MALKRFYSIVIVFLLLCTESLLAQNIPTPRDHFGFSIGDNYQLASFTKTEAYFKLLAAASNRARLVSIGKTEEGRTQFMMIVSSPENLQKLDHYQGISQQLAHAENLTDEQAHALAGEGKTVVWIDGGLHADEVVGTHQLIETAYQLLSRNDPETMRILDNVIILLTHANPDGQALVSDWYMRNPVPERRSLEQVPRLYEKYAGHDNNRDFYMLNLKETQNIARQLFVEWLPQIMYNHHQAGPAGSIVAGPPYRDPFNYVFDPLVITSIDAVGAAMNNRLNTEGKPGYTERSGSSFSTWYNGGLRTTTYFHNMIGLLTEIVGGPNPSNVPLIPQRLIPNGATPNPVTPQRWLFRQSIDYSVSLNYAVLDYASRYRDELLYNIYRMGRNSIERGNQDHWTLSPKRIDEINRMAAADTAQKKSASLKPGKRTDSSRLKADSSHLPLAAADSSGGKAAAADSSGDQVKPEGIPVKYFDSVMKNPALRDARGYILPSDQPDFPTAVRFINALIGTGISVWKASAPFAVAGKQYPAGSFIVKTGQAFRPHVLDLFEPQDHPNDFAYPGGPPIAPYDAAGWTLAYTMGIRFDRILDGFDGPFERIPYGELQSLDGGLAASGKYELPASAKGYLLDARSNASFIAANDLLKEGLSVYRIREADPAHAGPSAGFPLPGSFYVPGSKKAQELLGKETHTTGVAVTGLGKRPAALVRVGVSRIALWDNYGGSMASGWVRWILEKYHFPADVIYPKDIDTGDLHSKYDLIIFVGGAIPAPASAASGDNSSRRERPDGEPKPDSIPSEYRSRLGKITVQKSIPELDKFLKAGGHIVTIGSSANLAYHLGIPVRDALVELTNGKEKKLPGEKFYIPGSILRVSLDSAAGPAWGMGSEADVYFDESPVFNINPSAYASGAVRPIAWFANDKPLRSGWAWGQAYLRNGVAAFVAPVGKGKLYVFGPEITFRGQTHGTFKLLFNQLYTESAAE
jgi:Zinc carboxypeptidase